MILLPFLLLVLSTLLSTTNANTEILNFVASPEQSTDVSAVLHWPILNPNSNQIKWELPPALFGTPPQAVCSEPHHITGHCPYEFWVTLDLDDEAWVGYQKFTLRLSWPASFPVEFRLDILSPEKLANHLDVSVPLSPKLTRTKYARVRVVDTGVPVRIPGGEPPKPPRQVPFILIVEPLYLGILPASMLRLVVVLTGVLIVVWVAVVPRANAYFEGLARKAREEIKESSVKAE